MSEAKNQPSPALSVAREDWPAKWPEACARSLTTTAAGRQVKSSKPISESSLNPGYDHFCRHRFTRRLSVQRQPMSDSGRSVPRVEVAAVQGSAGKLRVYSARIVQDAFVKGVQGARTANPNRRMDLERKTPRNVLVLMKWEIHPTRQSRMRVGASLRLRPMRGRPVES